MTKAIVPKTTQIVKLPTTEKMSQALQLARAYSDEQALQTICQWCFRFSLGSGCPYCGNKKKAGVR